MERRRRGTTPIPRSRPVVISLFALAAFWAVSCVVLVWQGWKGTVPSAQSSTQNIHRSYDSLVNKKVEHQLEAHHLSRSGTVKVTADVRGNLGPASVVVQVHPGKDWIHDRWQAASDMHGTAIKGVHWIQLEFERDIVPDRIVVDWEAAYSDKYRIEASPVPFTEDMPTDQIWTLFDSEDTSQREHLTEKREGQSPGVKSKTPLHIIHSIRKLQTRKACRYVRLYILKSAMGWGVSVWQLDVYGFYADEVLQ